MHYIFLLFVGKLAKYKQTVLVYRRIVLTHTLTYHLSKVLPDGWRFEIFLTYRSRCVTGRKNRKTYSTIEKLYRKSLAVLYNWKRANRIEAGFSLIRGLNELRISLTDTTHRDIWLQFMSFRLMWKTVFLAFFQCFSRTLIKLFSFLVFEKNY